MRRVLTGIVAILGASALTADERTVGRWLDFVAASLDAGAASLAAQSSGDLAAARAANARGNTATAHALAVLAREGPR